MKGYTAPIVRPCDSVKAQVWMSFATSPAVAEVISQSCDMAQNVARMVLFADKMTDEFFGRFPATVKEQT